MVDFSKIVEDATEQKTEVNEEIEQVREQKLQHVDNVIETLREVIEPQIRTVHISNGVSAVLGIPIKMARKHSIDKSCNVMIKDTDEGILISKLELV